MGACVRHHHHYYLRGKRYCPALRCLRTAMLGRRDKEGKYGSGVVQYFFTEPCMFGFEFSKKSDNIENGRSRWYFGSFEGIKNIIIQASHYEIEGEP